MSLGQARGISLRRAHGRGSWWTLFALVLQTVRLQVRSVVIWGLALGLYSAAMVASFMTFSGDAEQMNQLLEAYPKELLDAFGIKDLGDVENYLNSQVFLLAELAFGRRDIYT